VTAWLAGRGPTCLFRLGRPRSRRSLPP
jgi:hypothetical protein